jgi:hypothetical protein
VSAVSHPPGAVTGVARPAGYLVSHHQNDAFIAVNRLLKAGEDVYWPVDRTVGGARSGTGAMYVAAKLSTRAVLQKAAADIGLTFTGVTSAPQGAALKLRPVRIGLWDRYGGSSPSGWTRWLFERFEFPFEVVYAQTLDEGNLAKRFDVIILTSEAVLSRSLDAAPAPERLPAEYRGTTGAISRTRTLPALKQFVEDGGALISIGDSTSIGAALGMPVTSALVETASDGTERALAREQFYVPGSVVRVRVDNSTPLGYGFEPEVDVFFENSPVFRLGADAGIRRVAWFAGSSPLRSGWAWGQRYLEGGVAAADAPLGRGRVLLFGPEITFRAQPHGTFKFLFNAIYYPRAIASRMP